MTSDGSHPTVTGAIPPDPAKQGTETLVTCIRRFNRKERNLLVRDALGCRAEVLGKLFRERLARRLGLDEIPERAWWATDYHINWLVGAIAQFLGTTGYGNAGEASNRLVEGNQEDVDLLIAWDLTVVLLIEAKAYGDFDKVQLKSKLDRLRLLRDFMSKIADERPLPELLYVLMSTHRRKPPTLDDKWKGAGGVGEAPWVRLCVAEPPTLTVARTEGKDDAPWQVLPFRTDH